MRWTRIVLFAFIAAFPVASFAAKPPKDPPAPAAPEPSVFSVKVDYAAGELLVSGEDLAPGSVIVTIGGVSIVPDDGASSAELLILPFTSEVSSAVDSLGNYVLTLSTAGGDLTLTLFIPAALAIPTEPEPPGEDCPCSPEWDQRAGLTHPNGFSGQAPYCYQNLPDFVTLQFEQQGTFWVLQTDWDEGAGTGSCALLFDAPPRTMDSVDQFNACGSYMSDIVTVWGDPGNGCIF